MSPAPESSSPVEERARGVPRFLSCLVKGPLGCLFFVLGAAAVLVLLLPPALGRMIDRTLEGWFADHYAGRLEIGDAWLGSFYGRQRIERLILRDPTGDEVLRGELRAPSLADLPWPWNEARSERYGPIVLRIEMLRVVEDEDGTTNLERALELEQGFDDSGERRLSTDVPFRFDLEIEVARLRTANARGKETELADLSFEGELEWGPVQTHLVLVGGKDGDDSGSLKARAEFRRPEFGRHRPWTYEASLERAPTALARAVCAPLRPLALFAGARTDRVSWSRDGTEVAFLCEDDGARFELHGDEEDGVVSGGREGAITATLPCANEAGRTVLTSLLPLLASLECEDEDARHELRLADFHWPLDGDWEDLSGELELLLAPARGVLVPLARQRFGELATLDSPTLRMLLRDGVLECGDVEYPLAQGWLRVEGTLDLEDGDGDLTVSGEKDGARIEPVHYSGKDWVIVPAAARPPLPPEVSETVPPLPAEDR